MPLVNVTLISLVNASFHTHTHTHTAAPRNRSVASAGTKHNLTVGVLTQAHTVVREQCLIPSCSPRSIEFFVFIDSSFLLLDKHAYAYTHTHAMHTHLPYAMIGLNAGDTSPQGLPYRKWHKI
jgi:hypothetical protein